MSIITVLLLFGIFLYSCSYKMNNCKPIIEKEIVYKKCEIPNIEYEQLEIIDLEKDDYITKLKKLSNNYGKLLYENQLLKKVIETCK